MAEWYVRRMPKGPHAARRTRSAPAAERLELRIGGAPCRDVVRATALGEPEQPDRISLSTGAQRQLAGVKIGHAGLGSFLVGVRITGDEKYGCRRHLAEEHADHRRRPRL